MKGRPIDQLVFECMFSKPRSTDPQNFHSLLHRHLILEVRQEVHSFYGHLDTQEAKYPGLDYCHPIHRIRLSRWPWHRRLFRAFDALRLTNAEISSLTKWEGTKWAKERFERDSGVIIIDTADEGIPEWVEPEDRPQAVARTLREETQDYNEPEEAEDEEMEGENDSDGELESIGIALNQQLRERAARREAGETPEPLDEDWEAWLKNALDSGELPFLSEQIIQHLHDMPFVPQALFPPQMISAARAGRWEVVPNWCHDLLRRTLESEVSASETASLAPDSSIGRSSLQQYSSRRTYSDLRLPGEGSASTTSGSVRLNRTAQPGA